MLSLLILFASTAGAVTPDIRVPPGFTISQYSDHALAPDIYTMTIDESGRVLVAGRGYVRVLVDDNNDGIADRAIDLIDGLKDGPMGLLAEGDCLYVVSEGGLQRYRGYNGQDKLTRPPETLVKLRTSGEHDAHMVRRGPDGWLYLLCGNAAGVSNSTIRGNHSPVTQPTAGTLLRISPDDRQVEVVCDGFRNPYSFDFNLDGEPFATDSDNERCVGLPWYESCRFYHLLPGGNYGWRSPQVGRFWRKPPDFLDCIPPVCYLGRGSPTGVACYRHTQFPENYRGGFFLADWTFGRIDFVPLTEQGSSYSGKPEVFAEAVGTSGFAPTGLAVNPRTGALLVSIGGRGTRGGVYRISHTNRPTGATLPMARRSLECNREGVKRSLMSGVSNASHERAQRQALEMLERCSDSIKPDDTVRKQVTSLLSSPDPFVRRAAARIADSLAMTLNEVPDRQAQLQLAFIKVKHDPQIAVKTSLMVLNDQQSTSRLKLQAIRLLQLAGGDLTAKGSEGTVWEGYTFQSPEKLEPTTEVLRLLKTCLSPAVPELDREASRTIAALQGGQEFLAPILSRIEAGSPVEMDIHQLACLARLKATWSAEQTQLLVNWLLHLEAKVLRQKTPRDSNWPLRVEEILEVLARQNPALTQRLLEHREFGQPEHLLFVKPLKMPGRSAAQRFLDLAKQSRDYPWTPGLVRLMGSLSPEVARPVVIQLWDQPQLRDAIISVLAGQPQASDAPLFVQGLQSMDAAIVRASAGALAMLSRSVMPEELAAAIKALRSASPDDKTTREAVTRLLEKRSGEKFATSVKAWTEWAIRTHPEVQQSLATNDGFDVNPWRKREKMIPWENGDASRGRAVFTRASCAACHDGGRAMGPSLQGVGKRFSREDLLTAILQPSKDVSPRYRPTRVTTRDDTVFIGMIVYDASDGLILQTGPDSVVRIAGDAIVARRTSEISMMPAGLLDKLSDREIADLLAFLTTTDGAR